MVFKSTYDQNFLREAATIERSLQNILENYKITLEKVSKEIKEKNLFSDKKSIADHLEKAYAYGVENESREKVRALGMTWVGRDNVKENPIGRLGEVKHKLEFEAEYLKKLEKNPGTLEISDVLPTRASSDFPFINLGIGLRDNEGQYRGFLNARIDILSLSEILSSREENGLQFILFDEKGNEVISSLPADQSRKENLRTFSYPIEFLKGIFPFQKYIFPIQLPVGRFSYVLHFGYDQNKLHMLFIKQNYLSFLLLCSFLCIFSFFSYFYHKDFVKKSLKFYKGKNREKNIRISQLNEENNRLAVKENKLAKYIKTFEQADKEGKRFYLEINKRISHSLSNMLDIASFLLNRVQDDNKIEENPKELMEVFENTYIHSRFFTLKKEEELVSINEVLDEAVLVLSKQIYKKELQIKYLKEKITALLTDRTALKQAIINILGRAIKNSPKKGEIKLTLFSQENKVFFECKDNGYLAEYPLKEQCSHKEKDYSLDCMALEREDMEKLVKSLGGSISSIYKPYKGNTFLLQIPYQIKSNNPNFSINTDNIISFTRSNKKG